MLRVAGIIAVSWLRSWICHRVAGFRNYHRVVIAFVDSSPCSEFQELLPCRCEIKRNISWVLHAEAAGNS